MKIVIIKNCICQHLSALIDLAESLIIQECIPFQHSSSSHPGGGSPPPRSRYPPRTRHPLDQAPPDQHPPNQAPLCGQTHTCKNTTFANFAGGKKPQFEVRLKTRFPSTCTNSKVCVRNMSNSRLVRGIFQKICSHSRLLTHLPHTDIEFCLCPHQNPNIL